MSVTAIEKSTVVLISVEIAKEENIRALENLRTFRRQFVVETGDINTGEGLYFLIKTGLVYQIEHIHDFNTPDFAITQRGMLVFEQLKVDGVV